MKIIGVDPAPSKPTTVCMDGQTFLKIKPRHLKGWIQEQVSTHKDLLIAWDAPLSFNPVNSYSDRPIDKALRTFIRAHKDRIVPNAVSALPFAGCPHWAITNDVLGHPLGGGTSGISLADETYPVQQPAGAYAIEVHPAVTLALWWLEAERSEPMQRYKTGSKVSKKLAAHHQQQLIDTLGKKGMPSHISDDDELDAWVAWRMASDFLQGAAVMIGDTLSGAYVLPTSAASRWELDQHVANTEIGGT